MLGSLPSMLAVLFVLATLATAQTGPPRVGVLELTGRGVPANDLASLTDRLRIEVHATGRYTVIERERMEAILAEQSFQYAECSATECAVQVGELLGVEKMVAGSVNRVGDLYTINLRLIDVATGAIGRTAVGDCRCALADVLTRELARLAAKLAGSSADTPARITLHNVPDDARIEIDGRRIEWRRGRPLNIPAGAHEVEAIRPGFHRGTADVDLDPGEATDVAFTMKPKHPLGAMARSLCLPGWGQAYAGRTGSSALFILAEAAALGGAGYAAWMNKSARDDYDVAKRAYIGAFGVDQETLDFLRADMLDRRDDVDRTRKIGLIAAGAFLGLRALDVFDAGSRFPDLARVRMVAMPDGGTRVALSIPITETGP